MKEAFAFLFAVMAIAIAAAVTQNVCDGLWRNQLVKSGHAEYFLDAGNQRQWRMKEMK